MSTPPARGENPKLADLVLAGERQKEATRITDFVWMVESQSNAYLVTTDDGDVLVNAGFLGTGERTKTLLGPHRTGPLRAIILTQSHPDHFGGVPQLLEAGTQVVVHSNFAANKADAQALQAFYGPRTFKLWGSIIKFDGPLPPQPEIAPDVIVDRDYGFEWGGRRFEVIWTPDGETTDSLTVWLPREKIVFTGNLFGPVFLSMPFLNTLRGDKPRLVRDYLASLEKVRALGAEILITGHGEPIRGADRIRADLDLMHAAVTWVRDYTFEGMRRGKDLHTLMREVELPEALQIGEFHGKVSWAVRTIWEQYAGWFHYDSTTSLYGVPRSAVDSDLVELAGGAEALAARAQKKLDADQPLEAMHLLDIALGAVPDAAAALGVKKQALARLLEMSGGDNLSETMWLRSEIADVDRRLAS